MARIYNSKYYFCLDTQQTFMGMAVRWQKMKNVREKMVCGKRKGGSRWTLYLFRLLTRSFWCWRPRAPDLPSQAYPTTSLSLCTNPHSPEPEICCHRLLVKEDGRYCYLGFPDFLKGL